MTKYEELIEKFVISGLRESVTIELQTKEEGYLFFNKKGTVMIKTDYGKEIKPRDLTSLEIELFKQFI